MSVELTATSSLPRAYNDQMVMPSFLRFRPVGEFALVALALSAYLAAPADWC